MINVYVRLLSYKKSMFFEIKSQKNICFSNEKLLNLQRL